MGLVCSMSPALALALIDDEVFIGGDDEPDDKDGDAVLVSVPGCDVGISLKFLASITEWLETKLSIEWSLGGNELLLMVLCSSECSSCCWTKFSSFSLSTKLCCVSSELCGPLKTAEIGFSMGSGFCSVFSPASVSSSSTSDKSSLISLFSASVSLLMTSSASFPGDFDGCDLDWENLSLFLHLALRFWNHTCKKTIIHVHQINLYSMKRFICLSSLAMICSVLKIHVYRKLAEQIGWGPISDWKQNDRTGNWWVQSIRNAFRWRFFIWSVRRYLPTVVSYTSG